MAAPVAIHKMACQRVRDADAACAAPKPTQSRIAGSIIQSAGPSSPEATSPTSGAHEPATSHTVRVEVSGPKGSRPLVAFVVFIGVALVERYAFGAGSNPGWEARAPGRTPKEHDFFLPTASRRSARRAGDFGVAIVMLAVRSGARSECASEDEVESKTLAIVAITFVACAPAPAPAAAPAAPVAASAAPVTSAATGAPTPSAPSTPSDVVESNRAAFDACYAQARAKDSALGRTKVELTFTVNAEGSPQTVDLKYRNRFDDQAKECMRDAALALRFPAAMQGTQSATIQFTPPGP